MVCGTEGTFHIQPLDNPAARISVSRNRGSYRKGTQDVKFPRYVRYVDDVGKWPGIIRVNNWLFSQYDLIVQETLLKACAYLSATDLTDAHGRRPNLVR